MSSKKQTRKKPAANTPEPITFSAGDVVDVPLSDLSAHPSNPKRHSPRQVDQIAASIMEWGWTVPIVADENNTILAGHERYLAAQQLGVPEVPVVYVKGWSDEQKRAYLIADNKITENGTWIKDILCDEIATLDQQGFDIDLMGIDHTALFGGYPQRPQSGPQDANPSGGADTPDEGETATGGAHGEQADAPEGTDGTADETAAMRPKFTPNINPDAEGGSVSDADVEKAAAGEAGRFAQVQQDRNDKTVTCTCPHCGQDFDLVI
jgi:hypothetical protein